MHRGWLLAALLAISVSGCVGAIRLAGAAPVLDAKAVEADRVALRGREILVEGFISREGDDFFLLQGQRRAPDEIDEHGVNFWCFYTEAPKLLWLRGKALSRDFVSIGPPRDPQETIWRGRRVVVSGLLKDRNLPDELDQAISPWMDVTRNAVGPLENARIVQVLPALCAAGNH